MSGPRSLAPLVPSVLIMSLRTREEEEGKIVFQNGDGRKKKQREREREKRERKRERRERHTRGNVSGGTALCSFLPGTTMQRFICQD